MGEERWGRGGEGKWGRGGKVGEGRGGDGGEVGGEERGRVAVSATWLEASAGQTNQVVVFTCDVAFSNYFNSTISFFFF